MKGAIDMSTNSMLFQANQGRSVADQKLEASTFESMYRRSYKRAFNLAYRMLHNRADAEDVTQEAYARAWRYFDQFDQEGSFDSWLFRILTNLAISHLRYRRSHPTWSLSIDSDDSPFIQATDKEGDPHMALVSVELDEVIQSALMSLPIKARAMLLLADIEERSYQDIADIFRCPLGTVRSRIHRARQMMRRILENRGFSPAKALSV